MTKPYRPNRRPFSIFAAQLVMLSVITAALVLPTHGQSADSFYSDFQLHGDFEFVLKGQTLKHAEIYLSDRARAYLILAPELASPVLINVTAQSVQSVHLMKVAKRKNGSIDLLADATMSDLGSFRVEGTQVRFSVGDSSAALRPKPPLVGWHTPQDLLDHDPKYAKGREDYTPSTVDLDELRGFAGKCEVKVYFGNWCPACGRLVPKVLKVEQELNSSTIDFKYYGLPHDMKSDPTTRSEDLHGVPTMIVSVGGREVGRLGANDLYEPEKELRKLLAGIGG